MTEGRGPAGAPRFRRRFLFAATGALAALALGAVGYGLLRPSPTADTSGSGPHALRPRAERKPLPDFGGTVLDPPPAELALADLRGRMAFINVWASWCVPCREEAPRIARLSRRYAGRARFVGVDIEDAEADARAFVRRYRLSFPHLVDHKASIATKLGIAGIPTTFLVDREGRIAAKLTGPQHEAPLARQLDALLAENATGRRRMRAEG